MSIRILSLTALMLAGAGARGHALDEFRYRNRRHLVDRLAEIGPCEVKLAREPNARDYNTLTDLLERADAYVERWVEAEDRAAFARATADEALSLARELLRLDRELHLGETLAADLDETQLEVSAILTQRGFVARDADLRALERSVHDLMTRMANAGDRATADEFDELTFDVFLLTQQMLLARRTGTSGYETAPEFYQLLGDVFGLRRGSTH